MMTLALKYFAFIFIKAIKTKFLYIQLNL